MFGSELSEEEKLRTSLSPSYLTCRLFDITTIEFKNHLALSRPDIVNKLLSVSAAVFSQL